MYVQEGPPDQCWIFVSSVLVVVSEIVCVCYSKSSLVRCASGSKNSFFFLAAAPALCAPVVEEGPVVPHGAAHSVPCGETSPIHELSGLESFLGMLWLSVRSSFGESIRGG